jgi:AP-4 complex subunit mu-1
MISQFFILSPRGDTVITRDYLGNVPKVVTESAAADTAQSWFSSSVSWL